MSKTAYGRTRPQTRGFTLLEILLVVAAIGILAGIVIVAVNPGKQLGDTSNAQRRSDVNAVMNAVYQYALDNNGAFPAGLTGTTSTALMLGTGTSGCNSICTATSTANACINLVTSLVPTYIVDIPMDPLSGTAANTDYYIRRLSTGRLVVGSCDPEQDAVISVTR